MYNYNLDSNDDDDIFDDSKTLSDSTINYKSSTASTSDLTDQISSSSEFKDIMDTLMGEDENLGASSAARMILSFYSSVNAWLQHKNNEIFQKAIHSYFVAQQNNTAKDFVYYEKYYDSQSQLLKRQIVNLFVSQIVENPDKVVSVSNKLNLNLDQNFIYTYFGSFYYVNQFSILETYATYKSLSEYLSLPFEASILDNQEHQKLPVDYQSFSNDLYNMSMIKNEELKQIIANTLSESIKEFVKIKTEEDNIEE